MNTNCTSTSSRPAVPASQAILHAEPKYFVGKFKVLVDHIKPHPEQRLLSEEWADSLYHRFQEGGIDRAAHPIKVLLERDEGLDHLLALSHAIHGDVPDLPSTVPVLVYHGQHRVAACKKIQDVKEHWWYAEVYKQELQKAHPAELLTLMHSSNEEQYRFPTTDSDRFMVMYRLRQLKDKGTITEEIYRANQEHLEKGVIKDSTRQGLGNLLRSPELSDAISQALVYQHLRPGFNAGTWGKKLVKGRFYGLVAGLVQEMVQQCSLLQGTHFEVSTKPFQLSPQACAWKHLESAAKKKDHAWNELPGGSAKALARVLQRPETFVTVINPKGTDGWTFKNTALLPSVLTSDTVVSALTDMYQITQHFIHMIAGKKYLEKYMANQPHEGDDDHPVGIISIVLREKLQGKPSNYPDKVVLHMWINRSPLLSGLDQSGLPTAAETKAAQYKKLILESKPWWNLLRMLKMSHLAQGLGLIIPKVFADPKQNTGHDGGATSHQKPHPPTRSSGASSVALTEPSMVPGVPGKGPVGLAGRQTKAAASASSSGQQDNAEEGAPQPPPTESGRKPMNKRRRVTEPDGAGDGEEWCPSGSQDGLEATSTLGSHRPSRALRCHDQLVAHLQELEGSVRHLQPDEARALDNLVGVILGLQGTGYMTRVVESLVERVEPLSRRAQKASRVVESIESDEDELHVDEQVGREQATEMELD